MTNSSRSDRLEKLTRLMVLLFCGALLLVAGCTKLQVVRLENWSSQQPEVGGVAYTLPAAEFEITLTRKLQKCGEEDGDWQANFEFSTEVKVSYIPDLDATFFLSLKELDKFMKKTSVHIDLYENGTLKGFNAGFTDFTAEAITKTLGTALNLVTSATGLKLPTADLAKGSILGVTGPDPCLPKARKALNKIEILRGELDTHQKAVAKLEAELTAILKQSSFDVNEVLKKQRALGGERSEVERVKGQLAAYQSILTHTEVIRFAPARDDLVKASNGKAALAKWFKKEVLEYPPSLVELKQAALITFEVEVPDQDRGNSTRSISESGNAIKGIVYRQPLKVSWSLASMKKLLDSGATTVPQLGMMLSLPLESEVFEDQTLEAKFRPDGSLEFVQFSDEASVNKATNAFQGSAGALAQYMGAQRQADQTKAADEAARLDAETKRLQAELALKKARQELDEYNQSLSGN